MTGQLVGPSRDDLDELDCTSNADAETRARLTEANTLAPVDLTARQLRDLVNFLKEGLTDKNQIAALAEDFPPNCRVPSNLPVDGCPR